MLARIRLSVRRSNHWSSAESSANKTIGCIRFPLRRWPAPNPYGEIPSSRMIGPSGCCFGDACHAFNDQCHFNCSVASKNRRKSIGLTRWMSAPSRRLSSIFAPSRALASITTGIRRVRSSLLILRRSCKAPPLGRFKSSRTKCRRVADRRGVPPVAPSKRYSSAAARSAATSMRFLTCAVRRASIVSAASRGLSSISRISTEPGHSEALTAMPGTSDVSPSGVKRVDRETSKALASFSRLRREALRAPRSMSAIYVRCKSARHANSSCEMPDRARQFLTTRPNRFLRSLCDI